MSYTTDRLEFMCSHWCAAGSWCSQTTDSPRAEMRPGEALLEVSALWSLRRNSQGHAVKCLTCTHTVCFTAMDSGTPLSQKSLACCLRLMRAGERAERHNIFGSDATKVGSQERSVERMMTPPAILDICLSFVIHIFRGFSLRDC